MDLSHASFEGMKGLKVMAIIAPPDYLFSMIKVLLPQSIQWLTNLQILRFVGCELGDISFLLSLKRLEILDLRRSRFKVLPYGIEKLNKLKLLDLSRCKIDDCCDEVIGRCSQLEELYVYSEESPIGARIIDSSFLENVTFPKLQRYILKIGQYKGLCGFEYSCIRGLLLGELNIYTSGAIIKDLLQRADEVSLDSLHGGCKSIIPELVEVVGSMMSQLTRLYLCSCSEIEFLIRTNPAHGYCFQVDHVFPMLYELSLVSMYNLKQVCHGPLPSIFQKLERVSIEICDQLQSIFPGNCNLCNLRYLSISNCPKLTSLFTISVAQTLLLLQKLNVEKCTELKYIIFNEKAGTATRGQQFPVSDNSPLMFPNLRYLSVNRCDKLEYIFPISCAQGLVQLQEISIRYASQMKYVFDKNVGEDLSTNQNEIQIVFPHLKVFMLQNLPNLIKICSENYHPCWPSLKKLDWKNCLKLTAACGNINFGFKLTETHSNREDKPLPYGVVIKFSTLTKHIKDNSNPKERESGDNVTMFIEITLNRSLVIHDGQVCNEVSNLQASSNAIKQLPIDEEKENILTSSVEWLHLEHLPDLMFIWISFQNIDILEVRGCKKLKSIFSTTVIRSLPKLSHLDIGDCDELEEIISDPDFQELAFGNPSSSTCPRKVCFPNLRDLNVERCSKLKCLFSVTKKRASDETNDEEVIEFVFPKLLELRLINLPCLVDICRGDQFEFQLRLQAKGFYEVKHCPNFSQTTIVTLQKVLAWIPYA